MKNIFFIILLFFTINSYGQFILSPDEWTTITDTSVFDGISRAALVIGTSDDQYTGSPMISINRTDDEDIKVILAYWPSSICETSMLYVNFDNESEIHIIKATYSIYTKRYIVRFNPNANNMNIKIFIEKLKTCKMLHMRLSNACGVFINVDFTLEGAFEALKILN
ncbi:MAG: hypothetical protein WC554_09175 [Clostridia bacterium]